MQSLSLIHFAAHFSGDLGCIGRTRTQHDLKIFAHVADRIRQMQDALLTRDSADEQHVRPQWINAVLCQDSVRISCLELIQVNSVVDDADL